MCARQVPGDTHRDLVIHPVLSGRTFKHILVPIWLLTYVFRAKSYQVLVNGVTGKIAGNCPLSGWKIFFTVVLVLLVALVFVLAGDS